MESSVREYVRVGLTNAINELEAQIKTVDGALRDNDFFFISKDHIKERLAAYHEACSKQRIMASELDTSELWQDKSEVGRITKLIFNISYFIKDDIDQILAEIEVGQHTKPPEDSIH